MASALAPISTALGGVQVNPYALAQPTPPGLQILSGGNDYDQAMVRGLDRWTFVIQGFVALNADIGSQVVLDQLCLPSGSKSVKAALEADRTLSVNVESLHVLSQSPARVVETGSGNPMLLVEWTVQILAKGT